MSLLRWQVERYPTIHNEKYGYQTKVGSFGYTLRKTDEGKMVYDPNPLANKLDRIGDNLVRRLDDHVIKRPFATLIRHPVNFFKRLFSGPKRFRQEIGGVLENTERLGLSDLYHKSDNLIEITKPSVFTDGINLYDIFRASSPILEKIDKIKALYEAGRYIRQLHNKYGAVGELHTSDIIFQTFQGNDVSDPVLNLPDTSFNPEKYTPVQVKSATEPKAVELLDFIFDVGSEEYTKTKDPKKTQTLIGSVVQGYMEGQNDRKVINAVGSLAGRGRVILLGDEDILHLPNSSTRATRRFLSMHNRFRLGIDKSRAALLRQMIIDVCKGS